MFSHSALTPWLDPAQPPQVQRPVLETPISDIHRATHQIHSKFHDYAELSPTWAVGPICALMTLAEDGSTSDEELTSLFGEAGTRLRLPQVGDNEAKSVSDVLGSLELLLYGVEHPRSWEKYENNPFSHHYYERMAWCLSTEMAFFEDCVHQCAYRHLGQVIQGACVYHERSRTLIPVVCEDAVVVTVDHDLYDKGRELAAEAVRLIRAYRQVADPDLPQVSRVAFYTRRPSRLRFSQATGGRSQLKVVDTARL